MFKNYNFQNLEKIILREKGKISQVNLNEITHIETTSGICIIHKLDNQEIIISKNLKKLELELDLQSKEFVKINRNVIINCAYIKEISFKDRIITLNNNKQFIISKQNLRNVKLLFTNNS